MERDIREDWFMNQHFNKKQLQQIYDWEQKSGKVADIIPTEGGFNLHHIEDNKHNIDLCFMKEEYMLRRWAERLGYKIGDGKTSKQFEKEKGIKDEDIEFGKEIYRNKATSIDFYKRGRKFRIVSGDYSLVAKRTASNSYEILLLTAGEYNKWLETQNK